MRQPWSLVIFSGLPEFIGLAVEQIIFHMSRSYFRYDFNEFEIFTSHPRKEVGLGIFDHLWHLFLLTNRSVARMVPSSFRT